MLLFANNADSTLKVGALATDVQLYLADGTGGRFPQPGANQSFFVTLIDGIGNVEIVEVTARAGDVLTVVRARDNTTAKSFPQGAVVDHRVTAEVLRRMSPDSMRGANNGLAPLDADGRLPAEHLPASLLTQVLADARYMRLSQANQVNGFPQLDNAAKIAMAQLPDQLLTLAEGDAAYVKLSQMGAAGGVATLGANGKLPATMFDAGYVDLSPYAPKIDPTFNNNITVGGTATINNLTLTGAGSFADVQLDDLTTTGVITVKGGMPRGKLTYSTQPPSGAPGPGDEWVQHEA